ncbi:MAG TPA: condensation domain-containing protein [Candidatus Angelobacter sp.]|nr:condensation domain-containing protein [Candidatus Angelobacter sp.]
MSLHRTVDAGAKIQEPLLRRRDDLREYPLSLHQQHMWFQCQLDPRSTLYNVGILMKISGPLDIETFLKALQNTVDRHEALRTVFKLSGDRPVQQVLSKVTIQCPIRELPVLRPEDVDEKPWSRMEALGKNIFDLCVGPLFGAELLRCGEQAHYFFFTYHHLILDGFYSGQLIQEVASTYDRLRRGEMPPPAPRIRYGDFSAWLQERWHGGYLRGQADFWQKQLREPLPKFDLPGARSGPFPRPLRSQHTLQAGPELVAKLRGIGKRSRTTLFRVVMAALTLFLSRLTKIDELMFDIDFSGRPREMGHTIGFFANTLPVRLHAPEQERFCDLLHSVDSQLRQVSENREFPVRQLARKLKGRRDPTRPLSSVVVAQLGPLDWMVGELHLTGSMFVTASIHDLWLGVMEREEALEICFGYSQELFERDRVAGWVMCFKKLLEEVAACPEASLARLAAASGMEHDGLASATPATAALAGVNFDAIPNPGERGHWSI